MRYLLLSRNDWSTPAPGSVPQVAPAPVKPYPVDATEAFVNDLLRSNTWRGNPEYLLQRTIRLIKEIDRVGPLAEVVPAILTTSGVAASTTPEIPKIVLELTCEDCGFQAKNKAGLTAHSRKHKVTA